MNERTKELARMAGFIVDETGSFSEFAEKTRLSCFAELIVKDCADAADEAARIHCNYPGDYIVEHIGFGTEEGAATWRAK